MLNQGKKDIYIKIYCNIMNYDKIISEEINRFINEEVLFEFKKSDKYDTDALFGKKKLDKHSIDSLFGIEKSDSDKGENEHKKKKDKDDDKPRDIGKKAKKLRNGRRGEYNFKRERETNPNLNAQDAEDISDILDSGYINIAAIAQDVYPDHTPEGAQSQLRKKIKGLTNDNGSPYKIKKKEAFKIRRSLAKHLNGI